MVLINVLFSETPVYRVLYFQPSPLTRGRGFIISIDCVAWTYPLMLFIKLTGKEGNTDDTIGIYRRHAGNGAAFNTLTEQINIGVGTFE